jgi:hypothetical protein
MLRSSLPDGCFHVWIRGVCGIPPFPAPQDRTAAFGMLMKAAARFELRVEAACVMTTPTTPLSSGLARASPATQWFHSRYVRAFNRRYGRFGHVY